MRELRFRAWDKLNKKMLYDIRQFVAVRGEILGIQTDEIYQKDKNDYIGKYHLELMQFTGLLDKNGKEIYESDILIKYNNKDELVVEWWIDKYWGKRKNGARYPIRYSDEIEVIGNIYEHPELIKE